MSYPKLGTSLLRRFFPSIDLLVRCHDTPARCGTDPNAYAQEGRMDPVLFQQGILLELVDLIADAKRDFADPSLVFGFVKTVVKSSQRRNWG